MWGCPSSQKATVTPVFVKSQPLCTERAEGFTHTISKSSGGELIDMTGQVIMLS